MRACIKGRFMDHPSIAAVISWHLAANFVKSDDDGGGKVAILESKVKALVARLDRLEARSPGDGGKKKKKSKGSDD